MLYDAPSTPGLLAMIAADPPLPVSHLRPEIPAELESIVLRCLAKDPEERFASVAELALALKPFASAEGHDSVERIGKIFGRRSRAVRPPPLPGEHPATRAIVHVPQPPKAAPAPASDVRAPSRRLLELGVTACALAAAGALGVYVAMRSMEGALAAALAPRAVVADLSPALPAAQPALVNAVAATPSTTAVVATSALVVPSNVATVNTPLQAQPTPAVQVPARTTTAPAGVAAPAPARRLAAKPEAAPEAALAAHVADAKPAPRAAGLFDDAN